MCFEKLNCHISTLPYLPRHNVPPELTVQALAGAVRAVTSANHCSCFNSDSVVFGMYMYTRSVVL